MPMWTIHHPNDTYTAQDKRDFAGDITNFYTSKVGLPAFYVVVVFQEHKPESFFIGGEPASRAVRVEIDHIAVHIGDPHEMKKVAKSVDAVIAKHTRDRGLYCEFHVDETPRELWMVDGLEAPPFGSAAEAEWVRRNSPAPWSHSEQAAPADTPGDPVRA